jgi:hypothetical protein
MRLWTTFAFDAVQQKKFDNGGTLEILCNHPVVTGATMAFRRDCFESMVPFPSLQAHDQWMSFLLAARGRLRAISEPLMQYRFHGSQQIGPGATSQPFQKQISEARHRDRNVRLHEIAQFQELHNFLELHKTNFPHAEAAQRLTLGKISHLRQRAQLPENRRARLPQILHETLNGSYWRYSSGWKSIARDLFLP